jgi:hypothetical protein
MMRRTFTTRDLERMVQIASRKEDQGEEENSLITEEQAIEILNKVGVDSILAKQVVENYVPPLSLWEHMKKKLETIYTKIGSTVNSVDKYKLLGVSATLAILTVGGISYFNNAARVEDDKDKAQAVITNMDSAKNWEEAKPYLGDYLDHLGFDSLFSEDYIVLNAKDIRIKPIHFIDLMLRVSRNTTYCTFKSKKINYMGVVESASKIAHVAFKKGIHRNHYLELAMEMSKKDLKPDENWCTWGIVDPMIKELPKLCGNNYAKCK